MSQKSPTPSLAGGRGLAKGADKLCSNPDGNGHSTQQPGELVTRISCAQIRQMQALTSGPSRHPSTESKLELSQLNPEQFTGVTGVTPACESTVRKDSEIPPKSSFRLSGAWYTQALCLSSSASY